MNDKKQHIIETALALFADKGFHETSIQDIAESAGIAKGSVYLYFKSKEDLLVSALKHTVRKMVEDVASAAASPGLSPRERLVLKLEAQFRFSLTHRSFISMLLNERTVHVNDDLKAFMYEFRIRSMQRSFADIMDVYGERIRPYALDVVAALEALTSHYIGFLIIDRAELDVQELSAFLADVLDDAAEGMLRRGRSPVLSERMLFPSASDAAACEERGDDAAAHWLRLVRETIPEVVADEARREELQSYALVLERELRKPSPSPALAGALLAHLREEGPAAVGELVRHLEKELARFDGE